jgi:hypothetical protein
MIRKGIYTYRFSLCPDWGNRAIPAPDPVFLQNNPVTDDGSGPPVHFPISRRLLIGPPEPPAWPSRGGDRYRKVLLFLAELFLGAGVYGHYMLEF